MRKTCGWFLNYNNINNRGNIFLHNAMTTRVNLFIRWVTKTKGYWTLLFHFKQPCLKRVPTRSICHAIPIFLCISYSILVPFLIRSRSGTGLSHSVFLSTDINLHSNLKIQSNYSFTHKHSHLQSKCDVIGVIDNLTFRYWCCNVEHSDSFLQRLNCVKGCVERVPRMQLTSKY